MRARLLQPKEDDRHLEEWATSNSNDGNLRASEELGEPNEPAPARVLRRAIWGHGTGRWHLWESAATKEAITFYGDQLLITASLVVAELQVPCRSAGGFWELTFTKFRRQLTIRWRVGGEGARAVW